MPTVTIASAWPAWLLWLLPVVWLLAWHHRAGVGRVRVAGATMLRSAALAAIVSALMQPKLHWPGEAVSVVYVLDISGSISQRFVDDSLDWIAEVDRHYHPAQSRFVVFGEHAELATTLAQMRALAMGAASEGTARTEPIGQDATDLEAALLSALPAFAPDLAKRLVLLSDGNQTQGDVWRAMLRMRAAGVRVFAIPAVVATDTDAWVEAILVPQDVRERSPVTIEARLFSRFSAPARVELAIDARPMASRTVALAPGENRVSFSARFPSTGSQSVTVRVVAQGDQLPGNDSLTTDVVVHPRPHVLYVEGDPQGDRHLADALTAQGIRVSIVTAEQLSEPARRTAGKDAVILSNVRADSLVGDPARSLRTFVRDQGGGLVFVAGLNSYGQHGFANSEIEQLLPVKFEAKRKRQDLDLVLLLDRSSSMRNRKIELVKSAALATLDLLDPDQRLAVVAFDAQPHDIVPLRPVGDKQEAESLILRMTSSGQTNIYNALRRAQSLLAGSEARTKHIILLSDGLTAPPPADAGPAGGAGSRERIRFLQGDSPWPEPDTNMSSGFHGIVAELAAEQVTLSTVAAGEKPDVDLMANLAKWGSGRSYVTRSDAEVPTLFAAETHRLLGNAIVEEPFRPRVRGWSPAITGVDFASAPPLKGFVATKPKRSSEVVLEAKDELPLLAETHYGLGKSVGFLSDASGRWAANWLGWPGYARFWAQVVRDSARRDSGAGLNWSVAREGSEALVRLTALADNGGFGNALLPRVRIRSPNGSSSVVALRQVAPGEYRLRVPLAGPASAPWHFELLPEPGVDATSRPRPAGRRLFYSYADEYRLAPANLPQLRKLSEQTGGVFAPKAEAIFRSLGDHSVTTTTLWPYCATAALLLFLWDILVRRAPWRWRRTG